MFDFIKNKHAGRSGRTNRVKHKSGMKRKIFISLLFFSLVVLILIWLFQTVFFEPLYKTVRVGELKRCAERLVECDSSLYEENSDMLSQKYNICISIYKINGHDETLISENHVNLNPYCFIHNVFSDSLLGTLYSNAKGKDYYMETVSLGNSLDEKSGLMSENSQGESIIYTKLIRHGADEYMFI